MGAKRLVDMVNQRDICQVVKRALFYQPDTAEKFLDVEIFQQNTIKSISTGPEGYSTIVMRPTSGGSNWWSAEVCDMKGNRLFNRAGYQIYKARWYVENPFGYPEVHTL